MTTPGNLEMRIGNSTLIASTKSDGYDIYKIIPMLADSFDERMTPEKLKRWFKKSARDIINGVCDVKMGGIAKEVIIDADRRIILHNGDDEDYNIISIQTGSKFSYELVKAVHYELAYFFRFDFLVVLLLELSFDIVDKPLDALD